MEGKNLQLNSEQVNEKKQRTVDDEIDRNNRAKFLARLLERIKINEIIGDKDKKMDYIKNLDFEEFKNLLIKINGILRDIPIKGRNFDGHGVVLSKASFNMKTLKHDEENRETEYIPPYFQDKEPLLENLLVKIKQLDNLNDIALLTAVSINAIHPFRDGNGRTSRFFYTLINESFQNIEQDKDKLLKILGDGGRFEGVNFNSKNIEIDVCDIIKREKLGIDPDDRTLPHGLDTLLRDGRTDLNSLRERLLKTAPKEDVEKINNGINYLDALINDDKGFFGAMAFYKYLEENNKLEENYLLTSYESTGGRIDATKIPRCTVVETWRILRDLTSDDVLGIIKKNQEIKKIFVETIFDIIINPSK